MTSRFSPAARGAWEAYLKVAEHDDEDSKCILCHGALTPGETTWIDDLQSSGRVLDSGRNVCNCIRRCHLKCLLDKSSHVWAPDRKSVGDSYRDGVTSISEDFHLKCTREPPGHGIATSPPAAVLQCVCPTGHSCAVLMPVLSHPYSFGTSVDDTEAVFEKTRH